MDGGKFATKFEIKLLDVSVVFCDALPLHPQIQCCMLSPGGFLNGRNDRKRVQSPSDAFNIDVGGEGGGGVKVETQLVTIRFASVV